MNPNAPEKLNHPLFLIAIEKIHAALPGIVPNAGHDLVDEIIELHRLARSQLDTEMELRRVAEKNYSDLVALCTGDAPIDLANLKVALQQQKSLTAEAKLDLKTERTNNSVSAQLAEKERGQLEHDLVSSRARNAALLEQNKAYSEELQKLGAAIVKAKQHLDGAM